MPAVLKPWHLLLLTAVLIVTAVNAPVWKAVIVDNELQYADIVPQNDDELFYSTRVKEVIDGYPQLGNPYVYEHRQEWYRLGVIPELLAGSVARFFGLNIKEISLLIDLLAPLTMIMLLWLVTGYVIRSPLLRFVCIMTLFSGAYVAVWQRPVSPQLVFLPFGLYLLLALHPKRQSSALIGLRSALIGAMLYIYPYLWTYCLVNEMLLLTATFFERTSKHIRVHRVLLTIMPFLLIAVPYILLQLDGSQAELNRQIIDRLGLIHSRWPTALKSQVSVLVTLALLWLAYQRGRFSKLTDILPLASLLFAGLVVANQTIITGIELEFSSHYRPLIRYSIMLTVFLLLDTIPAGHKKNLYIGIITVVASIFFAKGAVNAYQNFQPPAEIERQQFNQLMVKLDELPAESVIAAPADIADFIPLYTKHYPLFSRDARLHIISTEELSERLQLQSALFPQDYLPAMSLIGRQYVNEAQNTARVCQLMSLFQKNCPVLYVPESDPYWQQYLSQPELTSDDALNLLADKRLDYLLAVSVPERLEALFTPIDTIGDYIMYQFAPPDDGQSESAAPTEMPL